MEVAPPTSLERAMTRLGVGKGQRYRRSRVFVLRSGVPWEMLPQQLGYGSGMTCWRRLRDWQEAGIWQLIHFVLLDWLARSEKIDWSRAIVDGSSIRAVFGGLRQVPILPIGLNSAASVI